MGIKVQFGLDSHPKYDWAGVLRWPFPDGVSCPWASYTIPKTILCQSGGHVTPNKMHFSFCILSILGIILSPVNVYRYILDVIKG